MTVWMVRFARGLTEKRIVSRRVLWINLELLCILVHRLAKLGTVVMMIQIVQGGVLVCEAVVRIARVVMCSVDGVKRDVMGIIHMVVIATNMFSATAPMIANHRKFVAELPMAVFACQEKSLRMILTCSQFNVKMSLFLDLEVPMPSKLQVPPGHTCLHPTALLLMTLEGILVAQEALVVLQTAGTMTVLSGTRCASTQGPFDRLMQASSCSKNMFGARFCATFMTAAPLRVT